MTLKSKIKKNKELIDNIYEKYEIVQISRRELKNAEYNPRKISDSARDKLKNNIKKVGSLEVQIWIEGPLGWGGSCVKVIPKKDVNSPSFLVNLWARGLQKGEYTNIDPEWKTDNKNKNII